MTKVQDIREEMIKARQSKTSKFKSKLQNALRWDRGAFKYLTIVVLNADWATFSWHRRIFFHFKASKPPGILPIAMRDLKIE